VYQRSIFTLFGFGYGTDSQEGEVAGHADEGLMAPGRVSETTHAVSPGRVFHCEASSSAVMVNSCTPL
jgi:hypothetical protein